MKRGDALVVILVLLVAGSLWGWQLLSGQTAGALTAEVYLEGQLVQTIPLNGQTEEFAVDTPYGSNTVLISGSSVSITAADCPNLECVRSGAVSRGGSAIACLPHRLVIRLTDAGEGEYDVIAG